MSAPVLEMAALACPCVEQRSEAVGSLRGGGGRDPELTEKAIADFERALFLEVRLADGWENASWLMRLREVAAPPGNCSKFSGLEKSAVGAVTALTRARSFAVRSVRDAGKAA
jgi:hypothetical protein